jgi:AraC-like DNA-binding protein
MAKNLLRALFLRNREFAVLAEKLAAAAGADVWVEDVNGEPLFGLRRPQSAHREAVAAHGETMGYVFGCEKAPLFAEWLSQWAAQESGRKKLGAEVLHLYREINLMFDFTEKLASALGLEAIARLALAEAGRLIPYDRGAVLFKPEAQDAARILAQSGASFDWERAGVSESSEILSFEGKWLMFAALRVGGRAMGALCVMREAGNEFSAEDLKLFISLALQSASAMESSIHYEESAARALEAQRKQLTHDLALRNPFFRKVAAIIENRFTDSGFGVEQLSGALHLSPSQLQRKIMAIADRTPLQIIRDKRMQKAKDILLNTDLSVAEAAFQSGFADPSYFTRIFRKEEGVAPSEWKEKQKSI